MSIGNVLIRPQLLDRRPTDEGAQGLDLLTGLGSRLLEDFLRGGSASQKIAAALEASATDFFSQFNARLQVTREKLLESVDPLPVRGERTARPRQWLHGQPDGYSDRVNRPYCQTDRRPAQCAHC